jgi:hypothetical protein
MVSKVWVLYPGQRICFLTNILPETLEELLAAWKRAKANLKVFYQCS